MNKNTNSDLDAQDEMHRLAHVTPDECPDEKHPDEFAGEPVIEDQFLDSYWEAQNEMPEFFGGE